MTGSNRGAVHVEKSQQAARGGAALHADASYQNYARMNVMQSQVNANWSGSYTSGY